MPELETTKQRIRATLKRRDAQVEAFSARLQRFLEKNLEKVIKAVQTGDVRGLEAAAVLEGMEGALRDAGLKNVIADAVELYRDERDDVLDSLSSLKGEKVTLSNSDVTVVEKLITFETDKIEERIGTHVGDIRSIMMESVVMGQRPDASVIGDNLSDRLRAQIQTELDTSLMAFNRTVNAGKAQDVGLKYFLYLGPDDKITRPFCQEHLGNVYTMDELAAMDNGQGLPVPQYLGGYNCRHFLVPVDTGKAEQIRNA